MKETSSCVSLMSGALIDLAVWCVAVCCSVLQCVAARCVRNIYTREVYIHLQKNLYTSKRDLHTPQRDRWKRLHLSSAALLSTGVWGMLQCLIVCCSAMCVEQIHKREVYIHFKKNLNTSKRDLQTPQRDRWKRLHLVCLPRAALLSTGVCGVLQCFALCCSAMCAEHIHTRGLHTPKKEPIHTHKRPTNTTQRPIEETSGSLLNSFQRDLYTSKRDLETYKHHKKTIGRDFRVFFIYIRKRPIYIQKRPRDLQTPQKDQ